MNTLKTQQPKNPKQQPNSLPVSYPSLRWCPCPSYRGRQPGF